MNANQVIKIIKKNGWKLVRVVGSHHHFKHTTIKGLVTLPVHGKADLHPAIINNLEKITQCSFKNDPKKMEKLKINVYTNSNQPFIG